MAYLAEEAGDFNKGHGWRASFEVERWQLKYIPQAALRSALSSPQRHTGELPEGRAGDFSSVLAGRRRTFSCYYHFFFVFYVVVCDWKAERWGPSHLVIGKVCGNPVSFGTVLMGRLSALVIVPWKEFQFRWIFHNLIWISDLLISVSSLQGVGRMLHAKRADGDFFKRGFIGCNILDSEAVRTHKTFLIVSKWDDKFEIDILPQPGED